MVRVVVGAVTLGGDEGGEAVGCVGAHAGEDVLVGGHGEAGVGVAESFGADLDRDAGGDEQSGVGVAQVVEPDRRQAGADDLSSEELADRFRVQRPRPSSTDQPPGCADSTSRCGWASEPAQPRPRPP